MKTIKMAAIDLYKTPFKYQHGYVFDGDGNIFSDDGEFSTILISVQRAFKMKLVIT